MTAGATAPNTQQRMRELIEVVQRLSMVRSLAMVQEVVRVAARRLTGADGATFILRDGDQSYYADEDAISPLWKGRRFPLSECVSGWVMNNCRPAVIEDVFADPRVPHEAYRPTFVKSLVVVPIRTMNPVGAIGAYWAQPRKATEEEVRLLQALADTTAVAMENVRVFTELDERVKARTAELESANRQLEAANRELLAAHRQADRVFAALAQALPGTVLDGKYRLDEQLGAGGFGAVYRGLHLVLDRPIAVKMFRPAPGNDSAEGLQRFLREGATASRLDHPGAVRVFDSGVSSGGVAFLVMELLSGRSLAQELRESRRLSLRRSAQVGAAVADVLAAAHASGIIHRDIKPNNIFLQRHEGREVVKVVDFVIARFFTGPECYAGTRLTQPGEYLGTPRFIAPERVSGEADDGRSDVFSLGALLFEMICGVSPWSREQERQMSLGLVLDYRPRPMLPYRADVPQSLEVLVGRSLSRDPADRPSWRPVSRRWRANSTTRDRTRWSGKSPTTRPRSCPRPCGRAERMPGGFDWV